MVEFGDLTDKLAGFKWEGQIHLSQVPSAFVAILLLPDTDLKLIFNALVSNPAWRANPTGSHLGFPWFFSG